MKTAGTGGLAPLCRIFEQSATGPLPPNAPPPRSFGLVAVRIPALLSWWWRGLGRPNPFFDGQTRAPISEPRIFNQASALASASDVAHDQVACVRSAALARQGNRFMRF